MVGIPLVGWKRLRQSPVWKWSEVYLIVQPEGKTWIMQTYTNVVDAKLTQADLPKLGERYKNLPQGWKFVVKKLDKDLAVIPPADKDYTAHVMADEFDNVYEGCGFDAACSYMPGQ
jgi:hypothetical protein